jgi:hypothetical protein
MGTLNSQLILYALPSGGMKSPCTSATPVLHGKAPMENRIFDTRETPAQYAEFAEAIAHDDRRDKRKQGKEKQAMTDTETTITDLIATVERVEFRVFNKPRFAHDCARCVYLGHWTDYDLYYCPQDSGGSTVVARYGDEGALYTSGMSSQHPALAEAKKRARGRGLLMRPVTALATQEPHCCNNGIGAPGGVCARCEADNRTLIDAVYAETEKEPS